MGWILAERVVAYDMVTMVSMASLTYLLIDHHYHVQDRAANKMQFDYGEYGDPAFDLLHHHGADLQEGLEAALNAIMPSTTSSLPRLLLTPMVPCDGTTLADYSPEPKLFLTLKHTTTALTVWDSSNVADRFDCQVTALDR